MKQKTRKKCLLVIAILLLVILLSGCGKNWVCDKCGEEFSGNAYYGMSGSETFCEDCARKYWMPIPYQNYIK